MFQLTLLIVYGLTSFVVFTVWLIQSHPWYVAIPLALFMTVILDFLIAAGMMYHSFWSIHKKMVKHHERTNKL
jgi:hypothetical protein